MKQDWKKISYLEDCETIAEAIQTAKSCLQLYQEDGSTFYSDLHCDEFKNQEENLLTRKNARNHMAQLKRFITKNSK